MGALLSLLSLIVHPNASSGFSSLLSFFFSPMVGVSFDKVIFWLL